MASDIMAEPRPRRSARVLLFDDARRLLLIRFVTERRGEPFVFWATPGGEVEDGEVEAEAAARELEEELGLKVPLAGPVHQSTSRFELSGASVTNTDAFFVGRCEPGDPCLKGVTPAERRAMTELRWWTPSELEQTGETVFPLGLPALVRRLASEAVVPP